MTASYAILVRVPATRYLLASVILLTATASAPAAVQTDPAARAALIGQPKALQVQPSAITLTGPRALQQLVVSATYADGSVRDLSAVCDYRVESPAVASVSPDGLLTPRGDGETVLVVQAGGQTARVGITVRDFARPQPISFRHDVVGVLNVAGCNAGACHGTPSGKNGFKLSLRGYDPEADYVQLTRDVFGRRTDRLKPDASLILLKPLGRVPHEGGIRFGPQSLQAGILRGWIREGLRDDRADLPAVKHLEIRPGSRILRAPARGQQLAVLAHFTDGSVRDVTRLTVFSSSENVTAEVSPTGLVEFLQPGEVAILCRYLETLQTVNLAYLEPRQGFAWNDPPEHNYIDKHVYAKLKLLSIQPSDLCSDEEFVRRAYLDVCAILPSPTEVKAFLADPAKDRRARLIDALLERPEYADFWTMKWMDVLRSTRKTLQKQGVEAYRGWLHNHLTKNAPLDRVVRELLTSGGNAWKVGPANYYRAVREPEELAETTAQLFLGARMQCARCHNHPFERWTQDDYYSLAAFFARVKVKTESGKKFNPKKAEPELVLVETRGEVKHLRTGKEMPPRFPGAVPAVIAPDQDRREVLADWLTGPDNPLFAKSVVNRIWYHLLGRGIVDPVDDFRDSNPSANDALLDALAKDFVASKYDLKRLIRTIMTSRTYQLSAQSNPFNETDVKYFSKTIPKLLTAEQLLDAICIATGVPEKFADAPLGTRAVQLLDPEVNHPFLKGFGQPGRELTCECERDPEANLTQALQMINGSTVQALLTNEKSRVARLLREKLKDEEILTELYLATLSRYPRPHEVQRALAYLRESDDRRAGWEDIQWALFNTKEFLFRH
jgi:hypothetical protein